MEALFNAPLFLEWSRESQLVIKYNNNWSLIPTTKASRNNQLQPTFLQPTFSTIVFINKINNATINKKIKYCSNDKFGKIKLMPLRLYSFWKEKGCFKFHFIEPPNVWKGFASFESKGESLCLLVNFEAGFHEYCPRRPVPKIITLCVYTFRRKCIFNEQINELMRLVFFKIWI